MRLVAVDPAEAAELRASARREPHPRTRVRLLGVANARSGLAIATAAQAVGAGRAALYDRRGRFRRAGLDGLRDRPRSGRPRLPRALGCEGTCLFGAVGPERGAAAGLVRPAATAGVMALHLEAISAEVAPGARAVVGLDGAGYHQAKALAGRVPATLSRLPLPPGSPALNPRELVWQDRRRRELANRVFADLAAVVAACCQAWNRLVADGPRLVSLTDFARARLNPTTS